MREGQDFLSKKVHSVKSQTSFRFQIHNIEHIRVGLSSLSRLILPWLVTLSRHSCISTKPKVKPQTCFAYHCTRPLFRLYPTFCILLYSTMIYLCITSGNFSVAYGILRQRIYTNVSWI